ncbi:hypothetical protein [Streptomyces sp. NPDC047097]|uniref:hypothetical protein n=1 Tax=Streptomyces sp. NPDC047097 TaxID=3155260 RepID=UPI0033F09798
MALAQIGTLGTSAGGLVRVSRRLREPVKDITAAVTEVTSAITRMGEWAQKAQELARVAAG